MGGGTGMSEVPREGLETDRFAEEITRRRRAEQQRQLE